MVVAGLVLDGDDPAVRADLDDVADAGQAEGVMPDRQRRRVRIPGPLSVPGSSTSLVKQGAADRRGVVCEPVFEQDQAGLPGQ